ncbi:MarR family winged helix-turn-helix transcriptional regulator [Salipaludibacillus sp. LMS25]|uniref:MarR family winged helix-turn-helix transcriptional regulator n=1 Tax=Salipaludibacillus sp. LMS25 TaxID=2924031 RepID=UPI0020D00FBF|nr:MarR family winged helix-turn-helix transcriptional regulator [Salipaludibacillus sp. LMS25]UTR13146.1 MarR family winged helix-turn-helix transcriptional regulator [Salipaludibacillus sp. LMS25]
MKEAAQLNEEWTDIYYALHYPHNDKITHQAARILQHVKKGENLGIKDVACYLSISQNTASEHIKRLIDKGYIKKVKAMEDERKVSLQLTTQGEHTLHLHSCLDEEKLTEIFQSLSPEDKQMVLKAFSILSEGAKQCT